MILDNLKNASLYEFCHENFKFAFEMIEDAVRDKLSPGKYEFHGNLKEKKLWASVQEYETRPREERKFEGHRKYVDIQYIISGHEEMDCCDLSRMEEITAYDEEKDCQFFVPKEQTTRMTLKAGDYAIFFPDDIHKPGISPDGETVAVKKIVVKVEI